MWVSNPADPWIPNIHTEKSFLGKAMGPPVSDHEFLDLQQYPGPGHSLLLTYNYSSF